jgi:uncharacterized membrane protein YozB (DUF420 family)
MLSTSKTVRLLRVAIIAVLITGLALITSLLPVFSQRNADHVHVRTIAIVQTVIACSYAAAQLFFLWIMIRYYRESRIQKPEQENWAKDLLGLDDDLARLMAKKDW